MYLIEMDIYKVQPCLKSSWIMMNLGCFQFVFFNPSNCIKFSKTFQLTNNINNFNFIPADFDKSSKRITRNHLSCMVPVVLGWFSICECFWQNIGSVENYNIMTIKATIWSPPASLPQAPTYVTALWNVRYLYSVASCIPKTPKHLHRFM